MIILSLLAFAFSSFFLVAVVLIKTQWFKLWSGWILAGYIGSFVTVGMYLLGRWLGWLGTEWQLPFYSIMFGGLALINVFNGVLLLNRNWNFWAWTKVDD